MTDYETPTIIETAGVLQGPVRAPRNRARASGNGSIHDDATAQKLGFRGGTIAGSIHMDQFPPVLLRAFGQQWFETGSLSLSFRNATIDGEDVIAFVAVPPRDRDVQVDVKMERPDGTLVAEGTAGVGKPDAETHLTTVDLRATPTDDLRILEGIQPGHALAAHEETLSPSGVRTRIESGGLTEPLDWYTSDSPWGGPIANPSTLVQLLRNRSGDFGPHISKSVGLFGAIEIRHHNGPVLFGVPYRVTGEVVAVGASPKTEYVWYDTRAHDSDGRLVAAMRMQLRWMKASSPLYAEG